MSSRLTANNVKYRLIMCSSCRAYSSNGQENRVNSRFSSMHTFYDRCIAMQLLFPFSFNLWFSTPAFPPLSMNYYLISFIRLCNIDLSTLINTKPARLLTRPIKWTELQSNLSFDVTIEICSTRWRVLSKNKPHHFQRLCAAFLMSRCHFEYRSSIANKQCHRD